MESYINKFLLSISSKKEAEMRITFNIEKKYFYLLILFLLILGVGVTIASTWDNSQSHNTLWTTAIKGKNVNSIIVSDDLSLATGKSLCLNGVCNSAWPSSSLSGTGATNYVTKWGGVNSLMASLIYDNGISVGIGTTNPSSKLDVNGEIKSTSYKTTISGVSYQAYTIIGGCTSGASSP